VRRLPCLYAHDGTRAFARLPLISCHPTFISLGAARFFLCLLHAFAAALRGCGERSACLVSSAYVALLPSPSLMYSACLHQVPLFTFRLRFMQTASPSRQDAAPRATVSLAAWRAHDALRQEGRAYCLRAGDETYKLCLAFSCAAAGGKERAWAGVTMPLAAATPFVPRLACLSRRISTMLERAEDGRRHRLARWLAASWQHGGDNIHISAALLAAVVRYWRL